MNIWMILYISNVAQNFLFGIFMAYMAWNESAWYDRTQELITTYLEKILKKIMNFFGKITTTIKP